MRVARVEAKVDEAAQRLVVPAPLALPEFGSARLERHTVERHAEPAAASEVGAAAACGLVVMRNSCCCAEIEFGLLRLGNSPGLWSGMPLPRMMRVSPSRVMLTSFFVSPAAADFAAAVKMENTSESVPSCPG